MRAFAYALAAALWAVPALATAQGMAGMSAGPASPVSDALRGAEQRYAQNITAALEEFPAEKYRYRPTGTQMTVGETAAHLVNDGNYMLCSRVSGQAEPQYALVDANSSKEALIAALRRSFEFCAASFASLNDAQMADSVPGFGPMVTRANMALTTVGDWADHYSQLAIYLRLNGMLPPTARRGM